jgi:hypothetical protein
MKGSASVIFKFGNYLRGKSDLKIALHYRL